MKTGIIYKIIHNQSNICYVGSTLDRLSRRWYKHKINYKRYSSGKTRRRCSIHKYFTKYGVENFKCIEIKKYKVYDKRNLLAFEQLWINKLKSINEKDAFYILKKTKSRLYYKKNKEKIDGYKKKYYKEYNKKNKDKKKEYNKKYYLKNKEYNKKYYLKNKEKIKCECGSIVSKGNLTRHKKTKKHKKYLEKF